MSMTIEALNAQIITCKKCPRLVAWREQIAHEKRRAYRDWEYWGRPVPGFGDPRARVFVVGLAPGAHGSNRTGRQFTGDASGDFLYPALYRAGFASQPDSRSLGDGLMLKDLYIAPICRCVPPGNKPILEEMKNCQPYLEHEIELIAPDVFVALGRIAFERLKKILALDDGSIVFRHLATYLLPAGPRLVCSYHPSRQNTQTGRLSVEGFDAVWMQVRQLIY